MESCLVDGSTKAAAHFTNGAKKPLRLISGQSLEGETSAKLELAWRVDRVCDQSEGKTLLRRTDDAGHTWISPLRIVGHIVDGNIEAQGFRFSDFKRFVHGEVKIASPPRANVTKIGRGSTCNVWIGIAAVFGSRLNKTVDVEPIACRVGCALGWVADHIGPLRKGRVWRFRSWCGDGDAVAEIEDAIDRPSAEDGI